MAPIVDWVDFYGEKLALVGCRRLRFLCIIFNSYMNMSLPGLCTSFSKVTLFSLPEVFCGPQIFQKCVGLSRPQVGWEGGYHRPIPHPNRRLRRLDSRAFVAWNSAPRFLPPPPMQNPGYSLGSGNWEVASSIGVVKNVEMWGFSWIYSMTSTDWLPWRLVMAAAAAHLAS